MNTDIMRERGAKLNATPESCSREDIMAAGDDIIYMAQHIDRLENSFDDKEMAIRLLTVDTQYTHRLAMLLECALLDRRGVWNEGHKLLDEYRAACRKAMEKPE